MVVLTLLLFLLVLIGGDDFPSNAATLILSIRYFQMNLKTSAFIQKR
jgi:hypothetical protein